MNYSLVIDSTFKPYELTDLIPIYQANTAAQLGMEEQSAQLQAKANMYKAAALEDPKSKAAQIYSTYASDLEDLIDDLTDQGVNSNNRRGLMQMRGRYEGEIGNIARAVAARNERRKLISSTNIQDPTSMYWNTSEKLDNYLNDNSPDIKRISGAQVEKDAMERSAAESSRTWDKVNEVFDKYRTEYGYKQGFDQDDVIKIMSDSNIQDVLNTFRVAYGYDNLSDYDKKRFDQYALNGLYKGYSSKISTNLTENEDYLEAKQAARSSSGSEGSGKPTEDDTQLSPRGLYSEVDIPEYVDTSTYDKYFERDPKTKGLRLTKEGRKAYETPEKHTLNLAPGSYDILTSPSAFKKFVDEELSKYGVHKGSGAGDIGNAYSKFKASTDNPYDLRKDMEYAYVVGQSDEYQNGLWGNLISLAGNNMELKQVKFDGKKKAFKVVGDINISNVGKKEGEDDYRIIDVRTSRFKDTNGQPIITMTLQDKKNKEKIRVKVPESSINASVYNNVNSAEEARIEAVKYMNAAKKASAAYAKSKSDADYAAYVKAHTLQTEWQDRYKKAQKQIHKDIASMWYVNTTENQKHTPSGDVK